MTDTIRRAKAAFAVIQGGKPAPAAKDPIVKLRFDKSPERPQAPLTAAEVDELKTFSDLADDNRH